MRLPHQDHACLGNYFDQPAKGPQGFGDALVGFEKAEDADQGLALAGRAEALTTPCGPRRRSRNHAGSWRSARGSPAREPRLPRHRYARSGRESDPGYCATTEAHTAGRAPESAHAGARSRAPPLLRRIPLSQICVPIMRRMTGVGNQMVQIGFMQDHHAGMLPRGVVHKNVMRIVAQFRCNTAS